jgi:transcriptional regulator with XRE-family HTH domain
MNENEILKKFGNNLRRIRLSRNVSQEDMALEIGFDRTYISLLERGKRNPSLITICRLVAYLKVDMNQLFEDFDIIMKDFKWQKEEKIK